MRKSHASDSTTPKAENKDGLARTVTLSERPQIKASTYYPGKLELSIAYGEAHTLHAHEHKPIPSPCFF